MPEGSPRFVHGTAIAVETSAALIRGPSGSGKSDLALRCLALPSLPPATARAVLLADDQVETTLEDHGGRRVVVLRPPAATAGQIEVRGVGVVGLPYLARADLALVIDIVPPDIAIERLPDDDMVPVFGIMVPRISVHAFEPSAAVKVVLALLETCRAGHTPPTHGGEMREYS